MDHFIHKANIGTHSLSYALRGIPRQPGSPLVIILTGITSSALEWSAVARHIETQVPIFLYERSGYGRSGESPNEPTTLTVIDELNRLLKAAALEPPYLVVGHSWGGMLAREFIASRPVEDFTGLLLVDSVQEKMLADVMPDPDFSAVLDGVDYWDVVGIHKDHKLTDTEWKELLEEEKSEKHAKQADKEIPCFQPSRAVLAAKKQLIPGRDLLQGRPVNVLQGNCKQEQEKMYHAGVAKGGGTEEQRAKFRDMIEKWEESQDAFQRELLNLSSVSRFSQTMDSGHNIQLTEPERVGDEILWVLNMSHGCV